MYTVADYIADRLADGGIKHVFGVPGDFNLEFLDHIAGHDKLQWIGNANELNAGYAADGYARMNGIGAVVTTFGVGELSIINAIAGSYAEHVPVVHIVGAPPTDAQAARCLLHHTLGDGDFSHFRRMAEEVTCATADLTPADAIDEIDRVLRAVQVHRRPGYILVPTDVARIDVTPPSSPLGETPSSTSPHALEEFRSAATTFLEGRTVAVLADLLVHRMGATPNLVNLLNHGLPHATLTWGKTLVNEDNPYFAGVYVGAASEPDVRTTVENSDRLIMAGVQFTDITTAGFSHTIDPTRCVNIAADYAKIGEQTFAPLHMADALDVLADLAPSCADHAPDALPAPPPHHWIAHADEPLVQDDVWPTLAGALTEGNIVVADQGTSFFGLAKMRFPANTTFIGQPLWGSIGYTLPAAMGAGLACPDRRPVLVIGDGSAQLTVQELGTWMREGVHGVVIVVNNAGYTVERIIHGENAEYNNITAWKWREIPHALGGTDDTVLTVKATTRAELEEACELAQNNQDRLVLIEVCTAPHDYPALLTTMSHVAADATTT
ncbi:alpha-keto acid decarboxylase family protein [Corynebacterium kroppenstedtii]|uniref:alpha-keto acid decarboxylase family protein n=1 Tax=Corynebacterium sp. PCR 32 TaxID=3351342 RepID=UPI0030A8AE82